MLCPTCSQSGDVKFNRVLTIFCPGFGFADEDLTEKKSYLQAARELWTTSGGSSTSSRTIASNGVRYNTAGGNVSCNICNGNTINRMQYAVVHDPSRGKTVQGMCSQIVAQFMRGEFSNNMCRISQLRLKPACCPAGGSTGGNSWSFRRGSG